MIEFVKRKSFTLAEVLITLTIIGVIAAMTVPSLLSNYQKHTQVVGFKKAYSQLSQAVKMIPINSNCPSGDFSCAGWDEREVTMEVDGRDIKYLDAWPLVRLMLLKQQFKVEGSLCTVATLDDTRCWHNKDRNYKIYASFTLNDGTTIGVTDRIDSKDGEDMTMFEVDVNGKAGPNKNGRDIFRFFIVAQDHPDVGIYAGTVIPYASSVHGKLKCNNLNNCGYYWKTTSDKNYKCVSGNVELACSGRIFDEGKMDF